MSHLAWTLFNTELQLLTIFIIDYSADHFLKLFIQSTKMVKRICPKLKCPQIAVLSDEQCKTPKYLNYFQIRQ